MAEDVTIKVRLDGPYKVTGPVTVVDHEGREFVIDNRGKEAIALCRCGASSTKPFCDATHKRNGFAGTCPAPRVPPDEP